MQSEVLPVPIIWLFCKSPYESLHRKSLLICLKIGTRGPYFCRYRCPDSEISKIIIGTNRHEGKNEHVNVNYRPGKNLHWN